MLYCPALMEHLLQVDVVAASFFLGTLVPFLVGLVVKKYASSAVKAATNIVLSVAAAVLAALVQTKGGITLGQIGTAVMSAVTGSQVAYQYATKLGVTQKVQNLAPAAGLGKPVIEIPLQEDILVPQQIPLPEGGETLTEPPLPVPMTPAAMTPAAMTPAAMTPAAKEALEAAGSTLLAEEGFLAYIYPVNPEK